MKDRWVRNARSIVCFAAAFVLLFLAADAALHQDREYSGTWTRLREGGGVPQVIIMGNSHASCSFVPDIINEALGLDSAVLAASGLNSIGTTDSFEALLSIGAPEYLVIEANAYTFDYDATALYHKAEALSNINGMPRLTDRVKSAWREFGYESIPQGAFQLLRADLMWKRWKDADPVSAPDGSGLLDWHAAGWSVAADQQQAAQEYFQNRTPSPNADPRNDEQLRRVMKLAKDNGVKVLLVKAPTEHQTQYGADMLMHLENLCSEYGDTFLGMHDFHMDVADMGLTVTDFYDFSHLNRSGAAMFTQAFAKWMGEKIGVEADFSDMLLYGGEMTVHIQDERWYYAMYAAGEGAQYRFVLDGEVVQDWSDVNELTIELPPEEAHRLQGLMRKGEKEISFTFMQPNSCFFTR